MKGGRQSTDKAWRGAGEAEDKIWWERRLKQMWGVLKSETRQLVRYRATHFFYPNLTHLWLGSGGNWHAVRMKSAKCVKLYILYEGTWHKSRIGSLKPVSQWPVPLPRLKGDVKGLWPLPFMCIDPSGGGGASSSKPFTVSCYILVSPAGSGTFILCWFILFSSFVFFFFLLYPPYSNFSVQN